MPDRNVWIVIPAYNEREVIQSTIEAVKIKFGNIVVVDDCSSDKTAVMAASTGVAVCTHAINLGQGASLQTGIAYALSVDADYIVTFDADGQHCVEDIRAMIDMIEERQVDVVLGSRFKGKAALGLGTAKRLFLKAATLYTRLTSGLAVTDTHNGLRCFSAKAAKMIRIRHNRMAHASEILNQIGQHKLSYAEIPCTIIYTDYSREKGQRMSGAFKIVYDLAVGKFYK